MEISFINDEYSTNLDDSLALAHKKQLKYIELRNIGGKNVTDLTIDEASTYSAKIAQSGVLVSSIVTPFLYWSSHQKEFNIMGQPVDSEEEYFIKLMDLADIFGSQHINIYSYLQDDKLDIETLGQKLDKYSQMALDRGIVLLLNIDKKCTINNIHIMHQLFENYNFSNIYPLLNTGKIIADQDDYNPQELQDLINTCHYFHISDYDHEAKRFTVFGEGNVDFSCFLIDKKSDNYTFASLAPATNHAEDLIMSLNQFQLWED